jgi:hypothetical protein
MFFNFSHIYDKLQQRKLPFSPIGFRTPEYFGFLKFHVYPVYVEYPNLCIANLAHSVAYFS